MAYGESVYGEVAYAEGAASGSSDVTIAGQAFVSNATMLDGAGFPVTVAGEAFTASATMLAGTPLLQIIIQGQAWSATATMLDGNVLGEAIAGEAFASSATMLDGSLVHGTDTSNAFNGRTRGARAAVTATRPVAPAPPGKTYGHRVDKVLVYPAPVMADGRPA